MIYSVETERRDFQLIYPFMTEELGLRGAALAVYALIYSFTRSEYGRFHGSRDYIASRTGYSLRSVARALKTLCDKGYIVGEKQREYKTVSYRVNYTVVCQDGIKTVPRWHLCGDKMAHNNKYDEYISTLLPTSNNVPFSSKNAREAIEVEKPPYQNSEDRLRCLLAKHEGYVMRRDSDGVDIDYVGEPLYDLKPHRDYENVTLTTAQYMRLLRYVGKQTADEYIARLSDYIYENHCTPHSCYRTLLSWIISDLNP